MGDKIKIRLQLDHAGIAELLTSDGVSDVCGSAARAISDAAGEGFQASGPWRAKFGGGRSAWRVKAVTHEAKVAEAEDKALSRAVQSCRR